MSLIAPVIPRCAIDILYNGMKTENNPGNLAFQWESTTGAHVATQKR